MPTRKANHMMLGMMHRTRPIWDFGAILYWRAMRGDRVQNPGGVYIDGDPELTYSFPSSIRYTYFDPGRGHYLEIDRAPNPAGDDVPPVVPKDGHFVPDRSNFWDFATPINQRNFTLEAGLAAALGGQPVDWILKEDSGITMPEPEFPPDTFRVLNATGSSKRMFDNQASTSSTQSHMWSVLARRLDNGKVDATVLSMGVADQAFPFTGANLITTGTIYRKLRDDGWYQCSGILPPQAGGPSRAFFVELEDQANVFIECPQIERFTVGTTVQEPTAPIITRSAVSAMRPDHDLEMPLTAGFDLPPNGWMGCTVIPRTDNPSPAHPFGAIVEWRIDSSNRQRFLFSNSSNAVAFQTQVGGVSQAFLQLQPSDTLQGVPMGLCATWGKRNGSTYFYLAFNGKQVEVDTNGTIPTGGPTQLMIGSQGTSSPSPLKLPEFAVGDVNLSRHDCRLLSRWFKDRGFSSLAVAGA